MKLLGVDPEETVVIEDSASGAWAGVKAGCFTIAVPNLYTKHHDFSHTHWQLDSFSDMDVAGFFHHITRTRRDDREQIRQANSTDFYEMYARTKCRSGGGKKGRNETSAVFRRSK